MSATVTVPNGLEVSGYAPGEYPVTLLEHDLRDALATQTGGVTEATLTYGRADIMTTTFAFEVEPFASWRHGARQALTYAVQTDTIPALALFGNATRDQMTTVYEITRDAKPFIALWWHIDGKWLPIMSVSQCVDVRSPDNDSGLPARSSAPVDAGDDEESSGDRLPVNSTQAEKYLGVGRKNLIKWADMGELKPAMTLPNGRYLWDIEDTRRQLAQRVA